MPLKPAQKPTTRTASGSHELECGRHAHGGEARSHGGKNPCESRLKAIAKFGFAMLLEIAIQDGAFEVSWDGPEAHLIGLGAFRTARLRGGEHGLLDLGASHKHHKAQVQREGATQPAQLAILRSDYMLHEPEGAIRGRLLQVELNTIASSFGCLAAKVSALHSTLAQKWSGVREHVWQACGKRGKHGKRRVYKPHLSKLSFLGRLTNHW